MSESIGTKEYLTRYLSSFMSEDRASSCADALVKAYGSLPLIASTSTEVIAETVGVSMDTALNIKLLGYVHSRSVTDGFTFGKAYSEEEIKKYLVALFTGRHVEAVYCISLDKRGRVIGSDCLGSGIVNASEISARIVVECACKRGASSIILAHNHPKGTVSASDQDISSTNIMKSVLATLGIELSAHYLVSETDCVSLSEQICRTQAYVSLFEKND